MCIECWVRGTQTHKQTCFFVMKNLIGKMTRGRGEQTQKFKTTKSEKSQEYTKTFMYQII